MFDAETLAQLNGEYKMPAGAGPAWRDAARMGIDMTLIEANLDLTPWERILQNDRALTFVNEIRRCNPVDDGQPG
jgi:hypothetical protein